MASSSIYFIQNLVTKRIKIGKSDDVERRYYELSKATDCELELLGCVPGGHKLEGQFREQFAEQRYKGEWFDKSIKDEVLKIIDSQQSRLEIVTTNIGDLKVARELLRALIRISESENLEKAFVALNDSIGSLEIVQEKIIREKRQEQQEPPDKG